YLVLFNFSDPAELNRVVSLVIVITAIVAGAGAIANENLQDLKAGQMVGATPWKQQVILLVGVVVSALVVGPTLNLLFKAYGIGGVYPHAGMDPTQMLAAPQAGLIEAVAKGLLTRQLDWSMINLGIACGVVFVIIDEVLRRRNFRLACLAAGLGIYLPPEVIMPFVIGGIVSYFVKRNRKTNHKRSAQDGLLLACGLVAGNSLMGVLLAIPFVLVGSADALAVVSKGFVPYANVLGVAAFLTLMVWLYRTGRSN
nr:oligopeptide transporter, OPT family [Gammaproteobacteria bacterium]